MKKLILFLGSILCLFSCKAPFSKNNSISFIEDSIYYCVELYSPKIVRIFSYPISREVKKVSLVVSPHSKKEQIEYYSYENSNKRTIETADLIISFDKEEQAFEFTEKTSQRVLLKEKNKKKARVFTPVRLDEDSYLEVTHQFIPTPDEALYGLGQYQKGVMNYRGDSALIAQSNTDIANPFLVSTNGYGLLWDNYSLTRFKDDEEGFQFHSELGEASDYYFIYGSNINEVVAGYRELTGIVPMFPKWAFGFWQSKERYKSFNELEKVVDEYRKRNIPLDNIVQDWEYWGDKSYWNALSFRTSNFENPERVIERLHNKNVNIMLSVWPGFGPKTAIYNELDSIGALFNEETWAGYKVFDVYNPLARTIFWKHLKKGLYDKGVDAWWLDATEPSFRDGFTQEKQTERTKSAGKTYKGPFDYYLNTYSLELTKDLYQRFRRTDPEKRVFILTRSAFTSQQKYATAVWSGDVPASWNNLHKQISAGLNLSMSGIPYWTSDIGGFFVNERGGIYSGLDDVKYKELYLRWFQFGAFSPLFRAHGTNVPREIWQFGEPGTVFYDTQLSFIKLRYQLLPYIYSSAYEVTSQNSTLMRGLAMDFPGDTTTYNIDDSYLFGPSLLVQPVTKPLEDAKQTFTYLPLHKGMHWYNYWTNQCIKGGTTDVQQSRLDQMPLYIKGGAILPMRRGREYATQEIDTPLELNVYTGDNATFTLYNDDGLTHHYENGVYTSVLIKWNEKDKSLMFCNKQGDYKLSLLPIVVTLITPHGVEQVEKVIYDGTEKIINFCNKKDNEL